MNPSHFQMHKYSCIKWNWIALISRISHQIGVRHILWKSIDLLCILQRLYYSWGMEPYITFSVESFQGQVRLQMKLGYSRPAFSYWVTAHGVKIDNSPSHVTSHTIVSTRLLSSSANTSHVPYRLYVCHLHFTYSSNHHSPGSSSQQCDNKRLTKSPLLQILQSSPASSNYVTSYDSIVATVWNRR